MYSRFWHKVLYDLGLVNTREPFKKLVNQGMILGNSALIHRKIDGSGYVSSDLKDKYKTQSIHIEISFVNENNELNIKELKKKNADFKDVVFEYDKNFYVDREVEKMSKSKYNVISPDDICYNYGADTLRLYEMFLGPLDQSKPWSTSGIIGVHNFLKKLWRLYFYKNEIIVDESAPSDQNFQYH